VDNDQDLVWNRLKHGMPFPGSTVQFHGNGIATKFNSAWLHSKERHFFRVLVNDVAQSNYRDFQVENHDLIFRNPPADGANIQIEVYTK